GRSTRLRRPRRYRPRTNSSELGDAPAALRRHRGGVGLFRAPRTKGEVMATLVAIGYPEEATAEAARKTVQGLASDLIIQADQVAAINRDSEGKYHITTTHGGASTGGGAVWGGFWGFLFGLIFLVPFARLAIGAGFRALFGHLGEKAIDKEFQEQVRDQVKPGTSAL